MEMQMTQRIGAVVGRSLVVLLSGAFVGCAEAPKPREPDGFNLHLAPHAANAPTPVATAEAAPAGPAPSASASAAPSASASATPPAAKAPTSVAAAPVAELPHDIQFDKNLIPADYAAVKVAAGSVSLAKLDLNADGKPDYVVVDKQASSCGSSGCATTVYMSSGDAWLKGLEVTTRYISVSDAITGGARELLTESVTRWVWTDNKSYQLGERSEPGCVTNAELKAAKPPSVRKADKKEVARRFGASFDAFAEKQPKIYNQIMAEDGVSSFMMFGGLLELARLGDGSEILLIGGQGSHVEGYVHRMIAFDLKRNQALLLLDTGRCAHKQLGRGDANIQALLYAFTAKYDNL
jgi:hypothetical protein